ncbi:tRNA(Cytosine32)-2-thiocytidine synthetase [Lachnospiraceae bacterium KM106-2]|nr:tRNA(Cytosine32)-2-thiocytidine synthetase [Lachnospiraceae bacterium KM106-2]
MKLQQLLSYTRKAIDDYHMIEEGDRIAVGISGGKDSLTLLYALAGLRRFYPKHFEIEAITVHMGFSEMDLSNIEKLCHELDVPYHIVNTEIYQIVFEERKEENPCSLCSKMRKGAFNSKAIELGCNKLAYAHHSDDLIESMLMSFIYEGRLNTFSPVTYLDRTNLTMIRPLMYVKEADIKGFRNLYQLPVVKSPCPADGHTKREYAKNLVKQINTENNGAKARMFRAIINGNLPGWPEQS